MRRQTLEGWVEVSTLAKYMHVELRNVLVAAAESMRDDGEKYFVMEVERYTNVVWIAAIESRRTALAREVLNGADAAGGASCLPTSPDAVPDTAAKAEAEHKAEADSDSDEWGGILEQQPPKKNEVEQLREQLDHERALRESLEAEAERAEQHTRLLQEQLQQQRLQQQQDMHQAEERKIHQQAIEFMLQELHTQLDQVEQQKRVQEQFKEKLEQLEQKKKMLEQKKMRDQRWTEEGDAIEEAFFKRRRIDEAGAMGPSPGMMGPSPGMHPRPVHGHARWSHARWA